jgi:hypothetical protein
MAVLPWRGVREASVRGGGGVPSGIGCADSPEER